jgi:hypothetical protein
MNGKTMPHRRVDDCGHNAAKGTLVPCKRAGVIARPERAEEGVSRDKRALLVIRQEVTGERQQACFAPEPPRAPRMVRRMQNI